MSDLHTKFGWILSNGLGGDRVTDGWTDVGNCNIPDVFLIKCEDNYMSCGLTKGLLALTT